MDPLMVGIIGLGVLCVLFFFEIPVSFALIIVGFTGFWYLVSFEAAVSKLTITPFETISNYSLATLPLYILMAQVIFSSGMGNNLYNLAAKIIGPMRGGLAMATICGCAGFAAISASSFATISTMGMVALPEMDKYNYDKKLSLGSIAAGGGLGILIPPSGVLIIYGVITETSIGKLFTAGIMPGLILALLLMATIYILCTLNPEMGPPGPKATFKDMAKAVYSCFDIILLVVFVLGGLFVGIFTPTESAGVGAFGAVAISLLRKRITLNTIGDCIISSLITSGMLYALLIGIHLFMSFTAASTLAIGLANFVINLNLPPLGVIICIVLVYILLGTAMDAGSMTLLTIPIFLPLVEELGFSPIWFGILIVVVAEIAMISPPLGENILALKAVATNESMATMYMGIIPFFAAYGLFTVLLILVPQIATFLPDVLSKIN